jgi:PHP family Zn ribbon phosphoesterase
MSQYRKAETPPDEIILTSCTRCGARINMTEAEYQEVTEIKCEDCGGTYEGRRE